MNNVSIAIVTVIYNEKLEHSKTFQSLLSTASQAVFVQDNSLDPDTTTQAKRDFHIVHDPTNPGVSAAYNKAFKWAKKKSLTHVLLTDSDSEFPPQSLEAYFDAAMANPNSIIFPSSVSNGRKISPYYFRFGKSFYGDNIMSGPIKLGKVLAINSGMLIPISVFTQLKGFNESLKLDWSDVHFLRKAASYGVKAVCIPLTINHALSEHGLTPLPSSKYRYKLQTKGIPIVANHLIEKYQMYFWHFLKAIRLGIRYKTFWFASYLLKH